MTQIDGHIRDTRQVAALCARFSFLDEVPDNEDERRELILNARSGAVDALWLLMHHRWGDIFHPHHSDISKLLEHVSNSYVRESGVRGAATVLRRFIRDRERKEDLTAWDVRGACTALSFVEGWAKITVISEMLDDDTQSDDLDLNQFVAF